MSYDRCIDCSTRMTGVEQSTGDVLRHVDESTLETLAAEMAAS